MKMQANQIRPGWVIEHNNKQWSVIKINIITPGKGGAFIQVDMRDVATGTKSNERWRTADMVEKLMVEEHDCSYLYKEGDMLIFMNKENFEQISLSEDVLGDREGFLTDNMDVVLEFIEGVPVGVTLPTSVVLEITEAEPSIKGQTVTTSYKPAMLSNGMKIQVPPFVNVGDKVVVATEDCTYVERAK